MDFKSSKYLQDPTPFFHSLEEVRMNKENPFADWFPDSMSRKTGAPSTMGRPGYTLSTVGTRKNFPSKWDDAEKWVMSGHESPAHGVIKSADFMYKQQEKLYKTEAFSNGSRFTKESCVFHGPKNATLDHNQASNGVSTFDSCDVLLKDKFTNEVETAFLKTKCLEPMSEAFGFKTQIENSSSKVKLEVIQEAKNKDMGTEMTPTGSNTTSRCPTPLKSLSPPRHNTPLSMKDQSNSFDIIELKECHLAKIQPWTPFDLNTSKWSSREEEEEEISKSLRHFEIKNECLESISGPRPSAWEEKDMSPPCIRRAT